LQWFCVGICIDQISKSVASGCWLLSDQIRKPVFLIGCLPWYRAGISGKSIASGRWLLSDKIRKPVFLMGCLPRNCAGISRKSVASGRWLLSDKIRNKYTPKLGLGNVKVAHIYTPCNTNKSCKLCDHFYFVFSAVLPYKTYLYFFSFSMYFINICPLKKNVLISGTAFFCVFNPQKPLFVLIFVLILYPFA